MNEPATEYPKSRLYLGLIKAVRLALVAFLLVALFFLIGFGNFAWIGHRFDTIGPRLRKKMTGDQLQAWALAELRAHPVASNEVVQIRHSELANPLPKPLAEIWKQGPGIRLFGPRDRMPPHMQLTWGSGFLGTYGIEIGPTNFTGFQGKTNWQAGIYYWSVH